MIVTPWQVVLEDNAPSDRIATLLAPLGQVDVLDHEAHQRREAGGEGTWASKCVRDWASDRLVWCVSVAADVHVELRVVNARQPTRL